MLQPVTDLCSGEMIHERVGMARRLEQGRRSLVHFGTLCVARMLHTGCVLNADVMFGMNKCTVLWEHMHKICSISMHPTRDDQADEEAALLQIANDICTHMSHWYPWSC